MPKKTEESEGTLKRYQSRPIPGEALRYTETVDEKGNHVFNRDEIEKNFGPIDVAIDDRKIVLQKSRYAVIPGQWIARDHNGSITIWDDKIFKLQFEEIKEEAKLEEE